MAAHLLVAAPAADSAELTIEEYPWLRIGASTGESSSASTGHDHAFTRAGGEVRTASLVLDRDGTAVLHGGLKDLVVLKSTGSEYTGFLKDSYTSLVETDERILATSVTATWRYAPGALHAGHDFGALSRDIRATMVDTFAGFHSLALQQTEHEMASRVLDTFDAVDEVSLVMPNKHHFLYDLSRFGMDNPDVVYHADDRPYGLIEATLTRSSS